MFIFEKLYKGELCPIENSVPHTYEYRQAAHTLSELSKKLEDALDAEQQKIYESYQNARADVDTMIQIGAFRQGFKLGVSLAKEFTKMDNDC